MTANETPNAEVTTSKRPPFAQIPNTLTFDTRLTIAARLVYDGLMVFADNNSGATKPGMRTLATRLNVSTATVNAGIKQLEETGWLVVKRAGFNKKTGKRAANEYVVQFECLKPVAVSDTGTSRSSRQARSTERDRTIPTLTRPSELDEEADKSATQSELATTNTTSIEPRRNYQTAMKDALVAGMGWDTKDVTKAQWGRIEAAAKQLRDINADPAEVPHRCQVYRVNFNGATMTPNAVATNWADLAEVRVQVSKRDIERASNKAAIRAALEGLE